MRDTFLELDLGQSRNKSGATCEWFRCFASLQDAMISLRMFPRTRDSRPSASRHSAQTEAW